MHYYDKILVAIAGSVLGGLILGVTTALGLNGGLFLGTVVATVFVYDAMFRHPPLPTEDRTTAAMAVLWHAFVLVTAIAALSG